VTGFEGIPLGAVDFFAELELNNDRGWWTTHAAAHAALVRAPLVALGEELSGEFGTPKLFRPYRDVRFSADKSPYKTHQGVVVETGPGMGWYAQVSARGLMTAGGWYAGTPAQLAAYRAAVDDEDAGAALAGIVLRLRSEGYDVGGDVLKTRPKGVDPEHPRLALLRHRSLTVVREHGVPDWLETALALEHVRQDWRAYAPLMNWLADRVGDGTVVE